MIWFIVKIWLFFFLAGVILFSAVGIASLCIYGFKSDDRSLIKGSDAYNGDEKTKEYARKVK